MIPFFVLAAASFQWLAGEWVAGSEVHGPGCALAPVSAARLPSGNDQRKTVGAGGRSVDDATRDARARFLGYGARAPS